MADYNERQRPFFPHFGTNTTGLGLFFIALVLSILALIVWKMFFNENKFNDHYRIDGHSADAHGSYDLVHEGGHTATAPTLITNTAALGTYDSVTQNFTYNTGNTITITLPDSAKTRLEVGANSTEAKLYNFLSNAGVTVNEADKTQGWITCDRVYFDLGKSSLTAQSRAQIKNLSTILNAFPAAQLKVGGYTDNTGDAAINQKISNDRATVVKNALAAEGVKNILEAEGYGGQHFIATNDSPEGRALNRRVDVRVTKK